MQEMGRVTNRREKLNVDPLKGKKKNKTQFNILDEKLSFWHRYQILDPQYVEQQDAC